MKERSIEIDEAMQRIEDELAVIEAVAFPNRPSDINARYDDLCDMRWALMHGFDADLVMELGR